MAKADTPKTSETASVAPLEGNQKRSIQMKWFTSDVQKANVAAAYAAFKAGDKTKEGETSLPLGQIVGQIIKVTERAFEQKDGSVSIMLQAIGDFEAVNYSTNEVVSSGVADLPKYFLETINEYIEKAERLGAKAAVDCALEIVLVATGKNIPVAYEVRNLVQRPAESAVNRLKAQLANAGRLRLPPPVVVEQAKLVAPSGDYVDPETGEITNAPAASETASEEVTG